MTPQQALKLLGRPARGASVLRRIHAAPIKSSYLVARGGDRFVLRMDTPLAQSLRLDRNAELDVLAAAWHAGVGPEPIGALTAPPAVLLTRYVPGRAWTARDLRDRGNLRRLAALLRRVHAVPIENRHLRASQSMRDALMRYAKRVGTSESEALAKSGLALLATLESRLKPLPQRPCLCHYDPIAANVVGFRRTLLIDWEYAGPGDPLFDLAVVIRHHGLSPRSAAYFAASYFGAGDRVPWARLDLFYALYDHVLALWLLRVGVEAAFSGGQRTALRTALRCIRPTT